ncbi:MAG: type II toxin-antitoxin system PemK/MazF family toxin [Desulfobacterales bacterium]
MKKTRPCLVISPDEINLNIRTVIIAPMTSAAKVYPTRVSCTFRKKRGQIVLDQMRTIDKKRLIKRLGTIDSRVQSEVVATLQRLFAF